ncbi:MAG: sigma-E factor negative regulatory protein RseC [Candidatus Azotimanducaceae bacterium]|jgi:sigma-E factor negative regulatory protein RseC
MIKEKATVISRSGDLVEVQMQRQSACSHCEMSQGCGTGAIGRLLGKRSKPVEIKVVQDLQPGDQVEIGLPDKAFLRAGLLIYGMPLLGLFLGLMMAESIGSNVGLSSDLIAFIFALVGLVLGLFIGAFIAKTQFSSQLNPKILSVNSELKN